LRNSDVEFTSLMWIFTFNTVKMKNTVYRSDFNKLNSDLGFWVWLPERPNCYENLEHALNRNNLSAGIRTQFMYLEKWDWFALCQDNVPEATICWDSNSIYISWKVRLVRPMSGSCSGGNLMLGFEPNEYILKSETGSPYVRIMFWPQLSAGIRTKIEKWDWFPLCQDNVLVVTCCWDSNPINIFWKVNVPKKTKVLHILCSINPLPF